VHPNRKALLSQANALAVSNEVINFFILLLFQIYWFIITQNEDIYGGDNNVDNGNNDNGHDARGDDDNRDSDDDNDRDDDGDGNDDDDDGNDDGNDGGGGNDGGSDDDGDRNDDDSGNVDNSGNNDDGGGFGDHGGGDRDGNNMGDFLVISWTFFKLTYSLSSDRWSFTVRRWKSSWGLLKEPCSTSSQCHRRFGADFFPNKIQLTYGLQDEQAPYDVVAQYRKKNRSNRPPQMARLSAAALHQAKKHGQDDERNPHETDDEDQDEDQDRSRAARHSKSTGEAKADTLTYYRGTHWSAILTQAKIKYRRHIALNHGFPDRDEHLCDARDILLETIDEFKDSNEILDQGVCLLYICTFTNHLDKIYSQFVKWNAWYVVRFVLTLLLNHY